jgi:hypothetical protein
LNPAARPIGAMDLVAAETVHDGILMWSPVSAR